MYKSHGLNILLNFDFEILVDLSLNSWNSPYILIFHHSKINELEITYDLTWNHQIETCHKRV